MSETVRYGVIGTGMMGREHILNLRHLDGAEVVAVSDPNENQRQLALAAAGGAAAAFADHRDLLAEGGCDAVVVAAPNYTHAGILLDVIDAGTPVLVEKPLCTTVEDCTRVLEAATARDAVVWVGLEYRYMAPIARLVAEVGKGTAGRVWMCAIREHRFPFLRKVGHWNRFNQLSGGTLVEKCCHFFDLMNLILGAEPVRVMASGAQDVLYKDEEYAEGTPDILDNAYVVVEYDNGSRAMLDLCMFAEGSKNEQEIAVVGDIGKLEAFVPEHLFRAGSRRTWRVTETIVTDDRVAYEGLHHGSSYLEHVDFLETVRSGGQPAVSLRDGLMSVAVAVAAQRSIAEGRPVAMSEVF